MIPLPSSFDFFDVINNFSIEDKILKIETIGEGHINDTFFLKTNTNRNYLLQRINHLIFKEVEALMDNISRVTSHINQSNLSNSAKAILRAPTVIFTKDNKSFFLDIFGNYWRCYTYIPHEPIKRITPAIAMEGGKAIGMFQTILSTLPGNQLYETIPDFHNLKMRLKALYKAVEENNSGRLKQVEKEVDFIFAREDELLRIHKLESNGLIPIRVTHNDTKFNNILFDKGRSAVAIVDLDTVMNGSVLYDFGDAIRTLCNTAVEDESDLTKVNFNKRLFEAFVNGYLSVTSATLKHVEVDLLAFSCKLLTYIMAVRFLTDFLNGDVYFKVKSQIHNYQRAANQLKFLECIEKDFTWMEKVVRDKA